MTTDVSAIRTTIADYLGAYSRMLPADISDLIDDVAARAASRVRDGESLDRAIDWAQAELEKEVQLRHIGEAGRE